MGKRIVQTTHSRGRHTLVSMHTLCKNSKLQTNILQYGYYKGFVTRVTQRVSLLEQELLTLPEHLSSLPLFSGVRVAQSLDFYVIVVDLFFYFFCLILHCVSFFDVRYLITHLVSSNFFCLTTLFCPYLWQRDPFLIFIL